MTRHMTCHMIWAFSTHVIQMPFNILYHDLQHHHGNCICDTYLCLLFIQLDPAVEVSSPVSNPCCYWGRDGTSGGLSGIRGGTLGALLFGRLQKNERHVNGIKVNAITDIHQFLKCPCFVQLVLVTSRQFYNLSKEPAMLRNLQLSATNDRNVMHSSNYAQLSTGFGGFLSATNTCLSSTFICSRKTWVTPPPIHQLNDMTFQNQEETTPGRLYRFVHFTSGQM